MVQWWVLTADKTIRKSEQWVTWSGINISPLLQIYVILWSWEKHRSENVAVIVFGCISIHKNGLFCHAVSLFLPWKQFNNCIGTVDKLYSANTVLIFFTTFPLWYLLLAL